MKPYAEEVCRARCRYQGRAPYVGRPEHYSGAKEFTREDGSEGKDKTVGLCNRKGPREKLRLERIAFNKRARGVLKRQLQETLLDENITIK